MDKAEQMLRIMTFGVILLAALWYVGSQTVLHIVNLRGQLYNVVQANKACNAKLG